MVPLSPGEDTMKQDTAEYIYDLTIELAELADQADLATVSHLLRVTAFEAQQQCGAEARQAMASETAMSH